MVAIAALLIPTAVSALPLMPEPALAVVPGRWERQLQDPPASPAWILVEASTGQVVIGRRHQHRRPVASTIKTLTALSAVERASLDTWITVGEEVSETAGAGVGLRPGDDWTLGRLVDAMMIRSGNDAAEAVAHHVGGTREAFVEMMRADAAQLGIDGAVIHDPTGLDDTNRLSAHDLALLGLAALREPTLRTSMARPTMIVPRQGELENRNLLIGDYLGATGVKTGFTLAAGNSVIASAQRGERELVAVVLGAGDDPERFDDAIRLLDYGFTQTQRISATPRAQLRIAGGTVELRAVDDVVITLPDAVGYTTHVQMPRRWIASAPTVDIVVTGQSHITVEVEPVITYEQDPDDLSPGGVLGQALANAVYAGMRAGADAGRLR